MVSGRAKGFINVTKSCLLDVFYFKEINQKKPKLPRRNKFGQSLTKRSKKLTLITPKSLHKVSFACIPQGFKAVNIVLSEGT